MKRTVFTGFLLVGVVVGFTGWNPLAAQDKDNLQVKITNHGRVLQIADEGAYLNVTLVPLASEDQITRVVSHRVSDFGVAMVAEIQKAGTKQFHYRLVVARAPRCAYSFMRESKTIELTSTGLRYETLTVANPESDTVEVNLAPAGGVQEKPFRYYNGCTKGWFIFPVD